MSKVMFSFPEQLVNRMKTAIPPRERSKVLACLLETEITKRERSLFLCAEELEKGKGVKKELANWDKKLGRDGLKNV